MRYFFVLISLIFVLVSCWEAVIKDEEKNDVQENNVSRNKELREKTFSWSDVEKKELINNDKKDENDFFIETKIISEFDTSNSIQKIWKIIPDDNLDIKSQVSGKIYNIKVKQWQEVYKWQNIANIQDSYSKYYLDLEKADIDLEKQIISKESQVLTLNQRIEDAKVSLEDAKRNYNNALLTSEEDKKKAKLDLENSNLVDEDSQAYLEIEKAKFDYDNTINSNVQQINTYVENVKKEYNNLYLSIGDIIEFSDGLLWVTDDNKYSSDKIDKFLWAKDSKSKNDAKSKLRELIAYEKQIVDLNKDNISEETLISFMDSYKDWYTMITSLLNLLEKTLNNSITSVWVLSETEVNSYMSKVNSYQWSNQWDLSSFTSTKNSISSFLNTYKKSEESALKNVELQEKRLEDSSETWWVNYNKALISIQNTINSSETRYKQAELSLENAIKNKEVSIKSLDNSIASARNSRAKAAAEYSKLNISSPITWVVSSIDIDNNEDVTNGTKLFTVISSNDTQIEVALNNNEIQSINIWDPVKIEYSWKEFYWEVYSKSSLADENLDYNVLIVLEEKLDLIWWSTVVSFAWVNSSLILPFDLVSISGENKWTIDTFKDWKLEKLEVELWKIEGSNVEVLSNIPSDIQIITTDLENFNELNQTLKILK